MKKLIFCLAFLFIATNAFSQVMHNQQSATVAWDAVTLPTGQTGTMKYQVYTKNDLVSTTGTKTGGEITATQLLISPFTAYVNYYIGVESIFYPTATPTVPQKSATLAWSTNAADCLNGVTFGFLYHPAVNKPGGIRLISMLKAFIDGLSS